ncbi:hypothetical protein [Sulfuricurvum sp.]|uniref:hypothetical protein n=1 Tax=Sulfuricurvum sp. TaxID=2025608 RepID=UPI002E3509AC|nr:hypothetical protein [Sulfuricurvum sp.]HEX5329728.1 hypothetical protein [Sulfuricurvum sp.]
MKLYKFKNIAALTILLIISTTLNAAFLQINLKDEVGLSDGRYIGKEDGGQERYVLISHGHGAFESIDGGYVFEAECTDGFVVSKLPSKFKEAKKYLHPTDYILTKCREAI